MFVIDLIERKVGDIDSKVIPLDDLSPEDLDWIKGLAGGMTEEIYNLTFQIDKMRNCDSHLVSIDVVRILLIKSCVLLDTVLQGNLKKHPQMAQVCAWLNETKHTHKGELMFREREVHEEIEREEGGPSVLFGKSLDFALSTAPCGGKMVTLVEPVLDHAGDSMSEEDMKAMFERGCIDLSTFEPEVEEIQLTKVIPPTFEVDFEVKKGEPTELTAEDAFDMGFEALIATEDEQDLTEEKA